MLQQILHSPATDHSEMIDMLIHFALSITSSAVIATAALVLAFLRIPHGEQWNKLSRARWILFATFALLSISGYFKSSGKDTELLSLVTLSVASFQALLFTYTSSTLIAPASFSLRKFIIIFAVVILCSLLLVISKLLFPPSLPYTVAHSTVSLYRATGGPHLHVSPTLPSCAGQLGRVL